MRLLPATGGMQEWRRWKSHPHPSTFTSEARLTARGTAPFPVPYCYSGSAVPSHTRPAPPIWALRPPLVERKVTGEIQRGLTAASSGQQYMN